MASRVTAFVWDCTQGIDDFLPQRHPDVAKHQGGIQRIPRPQIRDELFEGVDKAREKKGDRIATPFIDQNDDSLRALCLSAPASLSRQVLEQEPKARILCVLDRAIEQIEQDFDIGLNQRWVLILDAAEKVTELAVDLGRDNLRDITRGTGRCPQSGPRSCQGVARRRLRVGARVP